MSLNNLWLADKSKGGG